MINLDATTKSLEVLLAGTVTTSQLPIVVSYVDILTSTQGVSAIAESDTVTNNVTAVTALAAPSSGHTLSVKSIVVYNADTVSATVTVQYNNNGTKRILCKTTLTSGSAIQYVDGSGWTTVFASGGLVSLTTGVTGTLPVTNGGTGDATLTNHGVLIGQGTSAIAATGAGTSGQVLTSNGASADPTFQTTVPSQVVQTTTATGTQNDFALTTNATLLRCNNATLVTFTGFAAGVDGQRLDIVSVGAGQVDIKNQDTGSTTAADRVINQVTGTISLAAGSGTATLEYDATTARWRVVAHMQGAWISVAYSAGNFTANGAMTWTVDSGDVINYAYWLIGKTLFIAVDVSVTTVGGTPNTALRVAIPGGFLSARTTINVNSKASDNGGTTAVILWLASSGVAYVEFYKLDSSNWTASTNNTRVTAMPQFDVQ